LRSASLEAEWGYFQTTLDENLKESVVCSWYTGISHRRPRQALSALAAAEMEAKADELLQGMDHGQPP